MKRCIQFALAMSLLTGISVAATLERLSLDDMTAQSTAIVRARVIGSYAQSHGALIYTHYRIQVTERFKGTSPSEFAVPGGETNGVRQDVPGAPQLNTGSEYVLFLWTGKSGFAQVIGLTQGIFAVPADGSSDPTLVRNATGEMMVTPGTGTPVRDQRLTMLLSQLRQRINGKLQSMSNREVK